jgi:hypothetical protein
MKEDPACMDQGKGSDLLAGVEGGDEAEQKTDGKDEDAERYSLVAPVDKEEGQSQQQTEESLSLVCVDRQSMVSGVEHLGQGDEVEEDSSESGRDGDMPPTGAVVQSRGQYRERGYTVKQDRDSEPEKGHRQDSPAINSRIFSISGMARWREASPETGHEYAVGMNPWRRVSWLALGVYTCSVFSMARPLAQEEPDASALLRGAFDKLDKAKQSKTRFTYLDLNRTQNFNETGKKTADITQLFEVTYIADLQYSRLLEVNGRALKGKELDKEQKRYDDAVKDRSALDDSARAKIQHQIMKDAGIVLGDLGGYRNTAVEHAEIGERKCVVIDSTPADAAKRKQFKAWVDPERDEMVQLEFTQLEDDGDLLKGGTGRLEWTFMDGTPLLTHSHLDVTTMNGRTKVHLLVDHTYTRFRKFSVTATIIPVDPDEKP